MRIYKRTSQEGRLNKLKSLQQLSLVLLSLHPQSAMQKKATISQHTLLSAGLVERMNPLSKLHKMSSIFGFMQNLVMDV